MHASKPEQRYPGLLTSPA